MRESDLLWVEVSEKNVTITTGASMPEPSSSSLYFVWGNDRTVTRKEFARWSGLTFPKGNGIYAVRCKLSLVRRYRKVSSEEFVAAKHKTTKLEEVK